MSQSSPGTTAATSARRLGPGLLVTAAFIGPGTVATASLAGATYGFGLLWALLLSLVATLTLQEMAMRIGLVARLGLAEALRTSINHRLLRWAVMTLIVVAIGAGNAAYEAGNLLGAVIGASELLPLSKASLLAGTATLAAALLASGRYRLLETMLITLVAVMAGVFLLTAAVTLPQLQLALGKTATITNSGTDYRLLAIALVGTTVVPYNLFLHAKAVQERWPAAAGSMPALRAARQDTMLAISLGALVTLAIMSTATAAFFGTATTLSTANLAQQLEPTLGTLAGPAFALGLLAAGLTSAITAPLAAAWALCGALGWQSDLRAPGFRAIWATVLGCGTLVAMLEIKPITAILLAQAANGLLLPVIAAALLWCANQSHLLGTARNSAKANVIAMSVVALVSALGIYKVWDTLQ